MGQLPASGWLLSGLLYWLPGNRVAIKGDLEVLLVGSLLYANRNPAVAIKGDCVTAECVHTNTHTHTQDCHKMDD